MSPAWVFKMY